MTMTPAQNRMIERAKPYAEYNESAPQWAIEKAIASFNRQRELAEKYGKPFEGATVLNGGSDFKVAYKLVEIGVGRVASCPITDKCFFILGGCNE